MLTKDDILEEIRRTAEENGDIPLGMSLFTKQTGITKYAWSKYWSKFGDAQKEAGLVPNQLTRAYKEDFLFEKMITLIRKLGKFPSYGELRIERVNNNEFPHSRVFFETKEQKKNFTKKLIEFCKNKSDYGDIIELSTPVLNEIVQSEKIDNKLPVYIGEVYLFKSGRYYKIGKTNDTVRRGNEIRIQLPEELNLIHSIKTIDPTGIEAYWHKRFEAKRMKGEWFDLNSADVMEFKRWRKII